MTLSTFFFFFCHFVSRGKTNECLDEKSVMAKGDGIRYCDANVLPSYLHEYLSENDSISSLSSQGSARLGSILLPSYSKSCKLPRYNYIRSPMSRDDSAKVNGKAVSSTSSITLHGNYCSRISAQVPDVPSGERTTDCDSPPPPYAFREDTIQMESAVHTVIHTFRALFDARCRFVSSRSSPPLSHSPSSFFATPPRIPLVGIA